MRKLLILMVLLVGCGKAGVDRKLLSSTKWTIKKVENINTGQLAPSTLNKGTIWTFNSDATNTFEIKNDFWDKTYNGTWMLVGDNLRIIQEPDTTDLKIEELTDTTLTWVTVNDDDMLRLYLMPVK